MSARRIPIALLACLAVAGLAGCADGEEPESPITIARSSAPDSLDPALASSPGTQEALWLVYTPLLSYRHADDARGAELIGGLASDLPEISADGLTYSLRLREGLEYSDGSPVRASDFEHAIARVLYLGSDGARFYDAIAGASAYEQGGDPDAGIEGIEADDETGEITITLTAPDPGFADALALTFAGLVPARTPFRDLSAEPPPGVGPYEITATDAEGGFVLTRSPKFAELDIPDIPTGNIAEITTRVVPSRGRQAQDVLDGRFDYMQDPPPEALMPTIAEQASDRFITHPRPATAYFFLDTQLAPFDDPLVREGVNRGLDRAAIAGLYGGRMEPGCALLAPGVPGYDRGLDTTDCPYGDPAEAPDLGAARALIDQAGAEGARVTVAAGADPGTRAATRAYAAGLRSIGLDPSLRRCLSCAQTGLRTWAGGFPRALRLFASLGLEDPLVASEVERLGAGADLDPAADDWSKLDAYVVSPPQSYVAVLGHPTAATFFSERIDPKSAVFHPVYGNDYSSWQLKQGE